jgi:gliding motility-associated-like protein
VYNRWGQKIFSSNAYPVGSEWDGKYMGRDVPVATYYYVIRLNSGVETNTEEEELYKGSVTVIR